MKKIVKLFYYVMFMLISILSFGSNLKEGDFYTLTVLHTNDIHGNVEDLPEYSTLIKQARENIKNLVVLEGGDIFARGEFEIFGGIPEISMINEMGYDAWVLGNNDFRLPKDGKLPETDETINNLIAASKQPTLCGNVIYKKEFFIDRIVFLWAILCEEEEVEVCHGNHESGSSYCILW